MDVGECKCECECGVVVTLLSLSPPLGRGKSSEANRRQAKGRIWSRTYVRLRFVGKRKGESAACRPTTSRQGMSMSMGRAGQGRASREGLVHSVAQTQPASVGSQGAVGVWTIVSKTERSVPHTAVVTECSTTVLSSQHDKILQSCCCAMVLCLLPTANWPHRAPPKRIQVGDGGW